MSGMYRKRLLLGMSIVAVCETGRFDTVNARLNGLTARPWKAI